MKRTTLLVVAVPVLLGAYLVWVLTVKETIPESVREAGRDRGQRRGLHQKKVADIAAARQEREAAGRSGSLSDGYVAAAGQALQAVLARCGADWRGDLVIDLVVAGEPGVGGVIESAAVVPGSALAADRAVAACVHDAALEVDLAPPGAGAGGRVERRTPIVFTAEKPR